MSEPASIAICIGHSRRRPDGSVEGGAISHDGTSSEWNYNRNLARLVATELQEAHGLPAILVNDYQGASYGAAMRWLAGYLRGLGKIKLAVELHFNSAEVPTARGHEWLYWHASPQGKRLAAALNLEMRWGFPSIPARGAKALDSGARGAEFLRLTHCPAVICEPFFGSNAQDWETASTHQEGIARCIAGALSSAITRP